jgi:ABC-type sulfate/molybdate transport systems ATPase subunit
LLDEPLSNVDELTKAEVRKNLKETIKRRNVTTLCVMHDPGDSVELGDRIAVMYSGKIIQCGRLQDLLKNPKSELVTRLITPSYTLNGNSKPT